MHKALRITLLALLGLLTLAGYGIGVTELSRTLVPPLPVVGGALGAGLLAGLLTSRMWGPLLGVSNRIASTAIGLVLFTGVLGGGFLTLNHAAGNGNDIRVDAVVEQRYTKTRHHTKRVGRRYTRQGEPYKVYYVRFRMPDGQTADISTSIHYYSRVHSGDTIRLTLRTGLFGLPVITDTLR